MVSFSRLMRGFLLARSSFSSLATLLRRGTFPILPVLRGRCCWGRRGKATDEIHEIPTSESETSRGVAFPSAPLTGHLPRLRGGLEIVRHLPTNQQSREERMRPTERDAQLPC